MLNLLKNYHTCLLRFLGVGINPKYFRPTKVETLLGDASKAKEKLGWKPKISFKQLVEDMCIYGQ